jgi:hypothetical protein
MLELAGLGIGFEMIEATPVLHDDLPDAGMAPRKPVSEAGFASSSLSIFGIASATGSHFQTFHGLLMRMPIRSTTKSPSIFAVIRRSMISTMVSSAVSPAENTEPADGRKARRLRFAGGALISA